MLNLLKKKVIKIKSISLQDSENSWCGISSHIISFLFCQFPDTSGHLSKTKMSPSKAENLAVTGEKKFQLSQEEKFLSTTEKNPYFIIL